MKRIDWKSRLLLAVIGLSGLFLTVTYTNKRELILGAVVVVGAAILGEIQNEREL